MDHSLVLALVAPFWVWLSQGDTPYVIYNYGDSIAVFSADYAAMPVNHVGNYIKRGPNNGGNYEVTMWESGGNACSVYVEGNLGPHRPDEGTPDINVVDPADRAYVVTTRHDAIPVRTTPAAEVW